MQFLIWSKDRACQLDMLIRSILDNCVSSSGERIIPGPIDILYTASDADYLASYEQLAKQYPRISFVKEESFKRDTISLIKERTICFCTDDCVFFDNFGIQEELAEVCSAFSYRLGFNTRYQHTLGGIIQPSLNRYAEMPDNRIVWKWTEYSNIHDYGYPMSVDGHVFLSSRIIPLLKEIDFNNPNQLESQLFYKKYLMPQTLSSYTHSRMVNVPVNNMSGWTRSGEKFSYSTKELNEQFLSGKRFRYDISGADVNAAHKEFSISEIS